MVNVYSIPAITALVAKGAMLVLSHRAQTQNFTTRLFTLAVLVSIGLSVVEAGGLIYGFHGEYRSQFGAAYVALAILVLATLVHLTIVVTFSNPPPFLIFALYGYALLLELLLLSSRLLFETFEPFKTYTVTSVGGPLFGLWEAFVIGSAFIMMFLPFFGLGRERPAQARNQCKLWIAAAAPVALLITTSIFLLHFKIHWFNSTVTSPLLITLLLAAIGYAVHNRRLIELDFYIPWSRTRREKKQLYEHLSHLYVDLAQSSSLQEVVNRLAEILKCPAVLVLPANAAVIKAGSSQAMEEFPRQELCGVDQMLVVNEIKEVQPGLHSLMGTHHIAAIVPFYPESKLMASWLLLGEAFCKRVYTPLDFKVIERLFAKLGRLLLDELIEKTGQADRTATAHQGEVQEQIKAKLSALLEKFDGQGAGVLDKPLEEHLSEVEALLLKQAIECCGGNRSKAARLLRMRPNTLHYKLGRYGLLPEKPKPSP